MTDSFRLSGSAPPISILLTPRVRPSLISSSNTYRTSFRIPSGPGAFPQGRFLRTVAISSLDTPYSIWTVRPWCWVGASRLRSSWAAWGWGKNFSVSICVRVRLSSVGLSSSLRRRASRYESIYGSLTVRLLYLASL